MNYIRRIRLLREDRELPQQKSLNFLRWAKKRIRTMNWEKQEFLWKA